MARYMLHLKGAYSDGSVFKKGSQLRPSTEGNDTLIPEMTDGSEASIDETFGA